MTEFKDRIFSKIKGLDLSPESERFLTAALYPPSGYRRVGIPDSNWVSSVQIDANPSIAISAPVGTAADATWDCLIVVPPGDVTAAFVVAAPSGTNFYDSVAPVGTDVAYSHALQMTPATAAAQKYNVVVTTFTATGCNTVSGAHYCRRSGVGTDAFRSSYRGVTLHCTSSELYNGGTLYASQFPSLYDLRGLDFETVVPAGTSETFTCARAQAQLPLDENAMTNMVPGTYVSEARHGVFMPVRHLGPDQPFCQATDVANIKRYESSSGGTWTLMNYPTTRAALSPLTELASKIGVAPRYIDQTTGSSIDESSPWWILQARKNSDAYVADTGFDNMATGVIIMRGLHKNATFNLTAHVGIEVIPTVTSQFRSLVSEPVMSDHRALSLLYSVEENMRFAYPANYNGIAALVPLIAKAARYIAPIVAPALSGMLGLATDAAQRRLKVLSQPAGLEPRPKPAVKRILPPERPNVQRRRKPKAATKNLRR